MQPSLLKKLSHSLRYNGLQLLLDAVAWCLSIGAALVFRFEFDLTAINVQSTVVISAFAVIGQALFGWLFWLYRARYTVGSFDEVRSLFFTALAVCVIGFGVTVGLQQPALDAIIDADNTPRSAMLIAGPIALSLMGVTRYLRRLSKEKKQRPKESAQRTLIFGAGILGTQTVQRMITDATSHYVPVGFVDDDPDKRNVEVRGVRVKGTLAQLAEIVDQTAATTLLVCIGRADSVLMRRVQESAEKLGLRVMVLPPLEQVHAGRSQLSDLRDISIEDLIGRHVVELEMESIAQYLQGARVLVTGAGGSIGSELCRQIARFKPDELIMLDRDETGLQLTQLSVRGHGLLDTDEVVLCDIREPDAVRTLFLQRRPTVVFHAAALKHLPMLEQYPDEAWKTNVLGTRNVLEAAREANVETFVNISTDKAANPTSVLGHSKRVAEKLTAWMAQDTGRRYLTVRFGNVIGSRGSMLPTFATLIEKGGPLTVTHPDVTRFFMTIPEACQLVIQAGGIGRPGEVLILDMGEPVRILDVAERMIAQSGKPIEIVFTGLREGEKLHEELIGAQETDERPFHPKISHTRIDTLSPQKMSREVWHARLHEHEEGGGEGPDAAEPAYQHAAYAARDSGLPPSDSVSALTASLSLNLTGEQPVLPTTRRERREAERASAQGSAAHDEAAYEGSGYAAPGFEGSGREHPAHEGPAHEGPAHEDRAHEDSAHEDRAQAFDRHDDGRRTPSAS